MPKLTLTLVPLILAGAAITAAAGSHVASDGDASEQAAGTTTEVVLASEVEWEPLNPARGDQSPQAATLWGDRGGAVPTGFLVKFADGFSSPPHIHNVSYRGVVIRGLVHNDDPDAADLWMPAGSFWTQPKGEVHVTAAQGDTNVAYIEIEEGPYLVLPTDQAFDCGERPVNVDPSNLVWLDASSTHWVDPAETPAAARGPRVAFLWGEPQEGQLNGSLVQLPGGFAGEIRSHGSSVRAVVVQGPLQHRGPDDTKVLGVDPGSYFGSTGQSGHRVSCPPGGDCILYARTEGTFEVVPGEGP